MARTWPDLPTGYVSVKEARARLGIVNDTIYKWMANGKLPSKRLGDRRIIAEADLETLLASKAAS